MEFYSAVSNKLLTHTKTCKRLTIIMLSERNPRK